jgi:hypothetical protein
VPDYRHEPAFGSFMTPTSERPEAVVARAAASLDLLSGGRFELGLGFSGTGAEPGRSRISGRDLSTCGTRFQVDAVLTPPADLGGGSTLPGSALGGDGVSGGEEILGIAHPKRQAAARPAAAALSSTAVALRRQ